MAVDRTRLAGEPHSTARWSGDPHRVAIECGKCNSYAPRLQLKTVLTPEVTSAREPAHNPQRSGQEKADQQAGGQGKVEAEVLAFDRDIAGKTPQPRN